MMLWEIFSYFAVSGISKIAYSRRRWSCLVWPYLFYENAVGEAISENVGQKRFCKVLIADISRLVAVVVVVVL